MKELNGDLHYGLTKLLNGYDFYRIIPNGMVPIDPDKYLNNIFMFSNINAISK